MSSKHTLRADCPFANDCIPVAIVYTYIKGAAATGPTYASGGDPGYGPEVEFVSVRSSDRNLILPANLQNRLDEWAVEYLASDEGYGAACDWATDSENDARERQIETRRWVMFGERR